MNIYSIPPLLTLGGFLSLAVFAACRGAQTVTGKLFVGICTLGVCLYTDILLAFNLNDPAIALRISRLDHFFIVYLIPLYLHFFHRYLNISARGWLVNAAYAYAAILMCLTPTSLYIAGMQEHFFGRFARGGPLYPVFGIGSLAVTVYVLILLMQAIRTERRSARKNKLKYVLLGFGSMGFLNGLDVFPALGYEVYPPGNWSFFPLAIFAVGLFRHDLLDLGIVLRKSLIYSLLTILLTGLYALIVVIFNRAFQNSEPLGSIYFSLTLFVVVALVFGPLKATVQRGVDHLFLRGRYDYQNTIRRISQMIVSVRRPEEIARKVTEAIFQTMKIDNCGFYVAEPLDGGIRAAALLQRPTETVWPERLPPDSPEARHLPDIKETLVRTRTPKGCSELPAGSLVNFLEHLNAELMLPLRFQDRTLGCIVVGQKSSGDLFSREDLHVLETLSSQSALAIENAHAYQAVEQMNLYLEQRVTERTRTLQQALDEKDKAQEQMVRSESLASLGQLVAGVAHELNNPLASATSLIQAVLEDLETENDRRSSDGDDDELIEDLKVADRELHRASAIVASLLGLSRQTQTYTEKIELHTVVEDALRVLQNQYKNSRLQIQTHYDPGLPPIQGNFGNLGQVAINLLKNAIQAAGPDGRIQLRTLHDAEKGEVVFECKDSGTGIPDIHRPHIFKPFYTTKPVGQGTGLGLYISHEIVRRHGGSLSLASATKGATRFVVRLPVPV